MCCAFLGICCSVTVLMQQSDSSLEMYAIHAVGTASVVAQQVRSAACPLPLSGTCKGCLPAILHGTP